MATITIQPKYGKSISVRDVVMLIAVKNNHEKVINESNLTGKYIEFWHKRKMKKFEDPGKYRIGKVKKISDGFVYTQCSGFNYLIRVARSDVIGQITHSGLRRKIEWDKNKDVII